MAERGHADAPAKIAVFGCWASAGVMLSGASSSKRHAISIALQRVDGGWGQRDGIGERRICDGPDALCASGERNRDRVERARQARYELPAVNPARRRVLVCPKPCAEVPALL